MKRRQFLTTSAATGAAAATGAVSAPALSRGLKELKLVTSFPKNFPVFSNSAARVAERITTATNGRVTVRLFNAEELVPAFGVFDAVSDGVAEMYFSAEYYFAEKSPAFNFFTAVPFGMTHLEAWAWLLYGGGYDLWRKLHAEFGMVPFVGPSSGIGMGGWANRRISSSDDFRGLKFHMPGLGGEVLRALGVAAGKYPSASILPALRSGALDGAEWFGPWIDLGAGFHQVVKHYHWPGFHEPGTMASFAVNKRFWERLSAEDRETISAILEAEVFTQTAAFDGWSPISLDTLVSEHDVKLHRFSDRLLRDLGTISSEVVSGIGAADATSQMVWDSYRSFRKMVIGWSRISLQGYMNARSLRFKYG